MGINLNFIFRKKNKNKKNVPTIYKDNGFWGDTIKLIVYDDETNIGKVYGWKDIRPQVNDILYYPMNSGKIGVFEFTNVIYCSDPDDMFFATVKFLHYLGDKA